MSDRIIINEVLAAAAALPTAARPYLYVLVMGEDGLSPFLKDLLLSALADTPEAVSDQHWAFAAAHEFKRLGEFEEAARQWAEIDYADTADAARAAGTFMAGLPSLIRAAESQTIQ